MISINLVTLLYLVASVCFIQALKGLSHPTTSRLGNAFGMAGMLKKLPFAGTQNLGAQRMADMLQKRIATSSDFATNHILSQVLQNLIRKNPGVKLSPTSP